ncbi:17138_t:CDS:2 [Racocetra fulgida]|uniref:17138_t:CDS:1 n=1 Tax=Racocetra fulgida TaxID=60492 RepID=A0A9N9C131_9GLOM|nr:17138_t:CDS:2 [Racocetra fulgida]
MSREKQFNDESKVMTFDDIIVQTNPDKEEVEKQASKKTSWTKKIKNFRNKIIKFIKCVDTRKNADAEIYSSHP